MTFEQALITGMAAVVTALCFFFKLLWARSVACEEWRNAKEPVLSNMSQQMGQLSAIVMLANSCKVDGCTLAGKLNETFSLQKKKKPEELTTPSNP
jgi:hypothetical protein